MNTSKHNAEVYMKNTLVALIAIPTILFSTLSFADNEQQGKDSKRSPEKMLSHLAQVLELTDSQQTQIKALIEEQKENREEGLSRREQRQAMKESMAKILTAEQFSELKTLREKRRTENND